MRTQTGEVVRIPVALAHIEGALALPQSAQGVVLFADGSGSSRHSPRNNFVAQVLREAGFGTLLMDLLTPTEESEYPTRFDLTLLTHRLVAATRWLRAHAACRDLPVGYFGASTGATAALQAAARLGPAIGAVVSRGGRPDLADQHDLNKVLCPTLLLVGGNDEVVIYLNRQALTELRCDKALSIVPGATHLFEEPGTLDEVARQAAAWFTRHLSASR